MNITVGTWVIIGGGGFLWLLGVFLAGDAACPSIDASAMAEPFKWLNKVALLCWLG